MPLTHSADAPAFEVSDCKAGLRRLFPHLTLTPFRADVRLAELSHTPPFAVYTFNMKDRQAGSLLASATHNRWRCFLLHDTSPVAWASLRPIAKGDRLRVAEVSVNAYIERATEAIRCGEQLEATRTRNFELRFLESPVGSFAAVWLHHLAGAPRSRQESSCYDQDLIIPISEHSGSVEPLRVYDNRELSVALYADEDDDCETIAP